MAACQIRIEINLAILPFCCFDNFSLPRHNNYLTPVLKLYHPSDSLGHGQEKHIFVCVQRTIQKQKNFGSASGPLGARQVCVELPLVSHKATTLLCILLFVVPLCAYVYALAWMIPTLCSAVEDQTNRFS